LCFDRDQLAKSPDALFRSASPYGVRPVVSKGERGLLGIHKKCQMRELRNINHLHRYDRTSCEYLQKELLYFAIRFKIAKYDMKSASADFINGVNYGY